MKEKPYKENKSSLNKFLEKKGKTTTIKVYKESYEAKSNSFHKLAKIAFEAYEKADEETLARLEAVGCEINIGILISVQGATSRTIEKFLKLQDADKYDNMWRGQMWTVYGLSGTFPSTPRISQDERYTVAGKTYSDKTEFLLSRTPLGKALL